MIPNAPPAFHPCYAVSSHSCLRCEPLFALGAFPVCTHGFEPSTTSMALSMLSLVIVKSAKLGCRNLTGSTEPRTSTLSLLIVRTTWSSRVFLFALTSRSRTVPHSFISSKGTLSSSLLLGNLLRKSQIGPGPSCAGHSAGELVRLTSKTMSADREFHECK